jgi:putative chitinase
MNIDIDTIKNLTGAKDSVAKVWQPIFNKMLVKNGINTKERLVAFLSQIGHESGGLLYTREIADGSAYEGRKDLGNVNVGDGKKFRGRGLIQITGRSNYQGFKNAYGVDVVNNPDLLGGQYATNSTQQQLENSLLASIWFWNRANLNNLADKYDLTKSINEKQNYDTITKITKIINGGLNGLSDRINKFEQGRKYLQTVVIDFTKKNWIPLLITFIGIAGLAFYLYKTKKLPKL